MTNRTYLPCRECGDIHYNPMSSSICQTCGAVESAQKATDNYDRETTASEDKHQSFEDAETVHELKEWIREYML
jgi:ribosomal protein L37E